MENEFSLLELRIIQSLLPTRSFAEIAEVIERPVEDISEYVSIYIKGKDIVPKQHAIDEKKNFQKEKSVKKISVKEKIKSEAARKKDIEKEQKRLRMQRDQESANSRKRKREPLFKTKMVDQTGMVHVRIDARTFIQIPAGSDAEVEKKKFFSNQINYKSLSPMERGKIN